MGCAAYVVLWRALMGRSAAELGHGPSESRLSTSGRICRRNRKVGDVEIKRPRRVKPSGEGGKDGGAYQPERRRLRPWPGGPNWASGGPSAMMYPYLERRPPFSGAELMDSWASVVVPTDPQRSGSAGERSSLEAPAKWKSMGDDCRSACMRRMHVSMQQGKLMSGRRKWRRIRSGRLTARLIPRWGGT